MIIAVLGRQNKIGLAELESVAGAEAVKPVGDHAALVDANLNGANLGSVTRLAMPIGELPINNWQKIAAHLEKSIPTLLGDFPEGKIKLGFSVIGMSVGSRQLFALGLEIKKLCRANGLSVRVVPNQAPELNSAQVLHNQLTGALGLEILIINSHGSTWIARTTWVQDVDAYASRDFGRPKRDAFVGMLPPKLAQIMLNLSGARPGDVVLDPFCGTGVVLQEAALLGCKTYGTDLSQKMIDYSRENLKWLAETFNTGEPLLEVADATNHTWKQPINHVTTEVYLGQPLSGLPSPQKLQEIMGNCNAITEKFLKNLHPQLANDTRICIAVPAWFANGHFKQLKMLDRLKDLGYNCIRFKFAGSNDLIYHRSDQIVARQLLVLTTK